MFDCSIFFIYIGGNFFPFYLADFQTDRADRKYWRQQGQTKKNIQKTDLKTVCLVHTCIPKRISVFLAAWAYSSWEYRYAFSNIPIRSTALRLSTSQQRIFRCLKQTQRFPGLNRDNMGNDTYSIVLLLLLSFFPFPARIDYLCFGALIILCILLLKEDACMNLNTEKLRKKIWIIHQKG